MGIVQSVFCTLTFCMESNTADCCRAQDHTVNSSYKKIISFVITRILSWACCGLLLIALIFAILMLMVYGISVGYHYAQKELTDFAYKYLLLRSPKGEDPQSHERALARKLIGRFRRSPSSIQTPSPLFHKTINQTRSISRSRGRTLAFK
ncbi:hypothetical protein HF086_015359 [Spodoptera exigua]|uniref:Uncharacterized protein n=1 Tax=Spodoptera exigua TaxID=7107 RepID=A0A922M140_SPOEX|nr:hypothetical protein HF086_015359 [Spodoptera exigua]